MVELWFIFALASAVFLALTNIFDKILTKHLHPWTIPAIKKIINGTILILISYSFFQFYFPTQIYFWIFILILTIPGFISTVFYFVAIKKEEISRILPYSASLVTLLSFVFAILFLSESVSIMNAIGALLVSIGVYTTLSEGKLKFPKVTSALILITLAAVLRASYGIIAKIGTSDFPPYLLAIFVFLMGDTFLWGVNLKYKRKEQIKSVKKIFNLKIGLFLLLACFGASLSSLLMYLALKLAPAAKVLPLMRTSILFLVLMSGAILKEKGILIRLIGTALIVVGIFALYF